MQRKDNSGALFKNDRKESDSHPDYKGQAMIDGSEYWVSAWINQSNTGVKYMALKYTMKEQVNNNGVQQAQQQTPSGRTQQFDAPQNSFEDDVPF